MSTTPRNHAYTDPATPQLPEPTYAERVRTHVALATVATLSTVSRKRPGYPFGSLMPFATDTQGRPLFLISSMAMHTQNLLADPRGSLFLGPQSGGQPEGDLLGSARATLVGDVLPIPAGDLPQAREQYLTRYENSRSWVDFKDFAFFRLEPLDLYYVGGFGVMGWVSAAEYATAAVDPLAQAAPGILAHMNADHLPAMLTLARTHAGLEATEAAMTSIDRLGFTLRLKTAKGLKGPRINFPSEAHSANEARQLLIAMLRPAKP